MVKHDIKVIDGTVWFNGVRIYKPEFYGHAEAIASQLEHALTMGKEVKPRAKGWVVENPHGMFLQDEGSNSIHAPGYFGDRKTAHVFATKKEATKAHFGLLGHGRNAKAVRA